VTDPRNEHTLYAHGHRLPDESDVAVAQRVARECVGAHARNARVTMRDGDRVVVEVEVDTLTRPDRTRLAMVRDPSGGLAVSVLPREVAP
jgi:hypothetical protein